MNPNDSTDWTRAQRTAKNLTIAGIEGLVRQAERTIAACNDRLNNEALMAKLPADMVAFQRDGIAQATADLAVAQEALTIRKGKLATGAWGGA
jgi:hypothetical protein